MAKVFVITGPSGVGIGTLIKLLRDRVPELAVSGHDHRREPAPVLLGDPARELNPLGPQLGHGRLDLVAHQEQPV
ncbi:MAG: hypothetical protein ABW249_00145, partial [Solirubrobacterales bacterium]